MRKVVFIFLLGAIAVSPFTAMANEDGWKDLKWGMTNKEIQDIYISEEDGKKCSALGYKSGEDSEGNKVYPSVTLFYDKENSIEFSGEEVAELFCLSEKTLLAVGERGRSNPDYYTPTGIYMYNEKFFAKKVMLILEGNSLEEQLNEINKLLNQLKGKYPNGRISYKPMKNFRGQPFKSPVFEYESDTIKIFNIAEDSALYFYNPKVLKEALKKPLSKKAKEEEQAKKKKELMKPF